MSETTIAEMKDLWHMALEGASKFVDEGDFERAKLSLVVLLQMAKQLEDEDLDDALN